MKLLKIIYFYLFVLILSIKWIFKINIGDYVIYESNNYLVSNGVRPNQWRLSTLNNNNDGWVNRIDCKKVYNLKNILNSFKAGYNFYMRNWYWIWVIAGIKPWMKNCNIW